MSDEEKQIEQKEASIPPELPTKPKVPPPPPEKPPKKAPEEKD